MKFSRYIFAFILCVSSIAICDTTTAYKTTVGMGVDLEFSHPIMGRLVFPYRNVYNLPIKPIELEYCVGTLAFTQDPDELRIAFGNCIMAAIAGGFLFYGNSRSFFGFGPIGILFAAPQCLGNFKVQLPIIKDVIHLYIGEATDYYLFWQKAPVYTESKAGVKLFFGSIAVDCAISKPWIKGLLKNNDVFISAHVGWYRPRKKMEQIEKESEWFKIKYK